MPGITVAKFGGSSLADTAQIRKAVAIVESDPNRRFVVVSAPGKRTPEDQKITDLLYAAAKVPSGYLNPYLNEVEKRFSQIVHELGVNIDLPQIFASLRPRIGNASVDYIVSRGEHIMGRILARALGYIFVDPQRFICLDADGKPDMAATTHCAEKIFFDGKHYVIPGFYGRMPDGSTKTFSRGGSDLSGAIVAAAVRADLYENWTDVSGMRMVHPSILPDTARVDTITYKEMRELTYSGAEILHDEVIFPLRQLGTTINLLNTNRPEDPGTYIVPDDEMPERKPGSIVGIAARKDFRSVTIEKALMNQEIGFIGLVCDVFKAHNVSIEHIPSGIDTISVVVAGMPLQLNWDSITKELIRVCKPDSVTMSPPMALICTVGSAMAFTPGVAARLFHAVAEQKINVRLIDQGSSETSITIGVENDDCERAVRAIYRAFEPKQ